MHRSLLGRPVHADFLQADNFRANVRLGAHFAHHSVLLARILLAVVRVGQPNLIGLSIEHGGRGGFFCELVGDEAVVDSEDF